MSEAHLLSVDQCVRTTIAITTTATQQQREAITKTKSSKATPTTGARFFFSAQKVRERLVVHARLTCHYHVSSLNNNLTTSDPITRRYALAYHHHHYNTTSLCFFQKCFIPHHLHSCLPSFKRACKHACRCSIAFNNTNTHMIGAQNLSTHTCSHHCHQQNQPPTNQLLPLLLVE